MDKMGADSAEVFRQAILLAKTGQREQARQMLAQLVMRQPDHELAWLWLSDLVESAEQRHYCLQRALHIKTIQRRPGTLASEAPPASPRRAASAHRRARAARRYAWLAVATALAIITLFTASNIVRFTSTTPASRLLAQVNPPTPQAAPSPSPVFTPIPIQATPVITNRLTLPAVDAVFSTPTSEFHALLMLTLTPTPPDDSIAPYLARAAQLARQDRFYEAWDEYERALKVWPDHIQVLYQRALMSYEADRSLRAVDDLNRALKVNPQFIEGYVLRGRVHAALLRFPDALHDFSAALAFDPANATVWYYRGQVYQQLGEDHQALANLDRALQLRPDYAEALVGRGDIYFNQGNPTLARVNYQAALESNEKLASAHIGLGRIALAFQSYEQAIQNFYQALADSPGDEDAMMYLGQALVLDGQYKTAVATLDQAIRAVTPAHKQAVMYEWRGRAQYALGNYDDAIQDLSLAIARYPTADRFYYRGLAYQAAGNASAAQADFEQSKQVNDE